jgi:hypothetical protein
MLYLNWAEEKAPFRNRTISRAAVCPETTAPSSVPGSPVFRQSPANLILFRPPVFLKISESAVNAGVALFTAMLRKFIILQLPGKYFFSSFSTSSREKLSPVTDEEVLNSLFWEK